MNFIYYKARSLFLKRLIKCSLCEPHGPLLRPFLCFLLSKLSFLLGRLTIRGKRVFALCCQLAAARDKKKKKKKAEWN